ncbi:MAG: hypothetical protein WCB58_02680 [Acidobacteriaceae bacterium]
MSTKNLGDTGRIGGRAGGANCGVRFLWSLTFKDVDYRVRYGILEICNAAPQRSLIATVEWR